ncbi:MAG: putative DNA binding domain-containing protein [Deltaproteobacteria bacterium]|nr:putative DNA binding domain-containing protein [Deltaproteobacteria bacterium]
MYKESMTEVLCPQITEDIKRNVIALVNSRGGSVYVGINNKGDIVGLADPHTELSRIEGMISEEIKPDVTQFIQTKIEQINDIHVILITVKTGTQRPYFLADKGLGPEGVFVRLGSSSMPATKSSIFKMISDTDGEKFENQRSIFQNLTFLAVEEEFSQKNLPFGKSEMEEFGLLNSNKLYTNLALLLSDQCEHAIQVTVLPDTNQKGYQTRREFNGSLLGQMKKAYRFLDINNFKRMSFSGLYRIDFRDYPEIAIFESLLNAVIHRDYSTNWNMLIKVFSDRIEFVSPGSLLGGIKIEEIIKGFSASRNPGLAKFFYGLSFNEGYGLGIPRIFEAYDDCPLTPKILVSKNVFRMILPNTYTVTPKNPVRGLPSPEETLMRTVYEQGSINLIQAGRILGLSQSSTSLVLDKMIELGKLKRKGESDNLQYYFGKSHDDIKGAAI